MLMGTLAQTTDQKTENILSITCAYQEVILVAVGTVQVPRRQLKNAANNGATQNAGKKSALLLGKEGIAGLFSR